MNRNKEGTYALKCVGLNLSLSYLNIVIKFSMARSLDS